MTKKVAREVAAEGLDPAAIEVESLARILGVEVDVIRRDLEDGAPSNPDGTINLVHYAAWLNLVE